MLEADILPHAVKRHVELFTDLIVHGVAAADILMLDAAAPEVDARVHLTIVAPRGAEREVALFIYHENVELLTRKLARDRHA